MGLYGHQQGGKITEIGFITMDTTGSACAVTTEGQTEEKQDEEAGGGKITELWNRAK